VNKYLGDMKTRIDVRTKIGFILLVVFLGLAGLVSGLGTNEKTQSLNASVVADK